MHVVRLYLFASLHVFGRPIESRRETLVTSALQSQARDLKSLSVLSAIAFNFCIHSVGCTVLSVVKIVFMIEFDENTIGHHDYTAKKYPVSMSYIIYFLFDLFSVIKRQKYRVIFSLSKYSVGLSRIFRTSSPNGLVRTLTIPLFYVGACCS